MRVRRLARLAFGGGLLAWGLPIALGSCSDSTSDAPQPDAAVDTAAPAVVVAEAQAQAEAQADGRTCAAPADLQARCSGSDPTFVFFPPVACPAPPDGGAGGGGTDAALDASEAGSEAGRPDSADAGPCTPPAPGPSDVVFTTVACRAFVDAERCGLIQTEPSSLSPQIVEPVDRQVMTPDEWSVFAWTKGPGARLTPIQRLRDLVEPSAHAATPLSGDGYVVVFKQGESEVLRAMVATTFWAPDPASWKTLATTRGEVTARVYWAKFGADGIVGGPVASAPITITMQE